MKRRSLLSHALSWPLLAGGAAFGPAGARAEVPAPAPGQQPGLTGTTLRGQPFDLRRLRGRVVLVYFWSTDCAPCRDLMPHLRAGMQDWGGRPFQLVAVSQDRRIEDVRAYQGILEQVATPMQQFPQLWRRAADYRDSFGPIDVLPASFLLDREGRVVRISRGSFEPSLWDDVARLLAAA